MTEIIRKELLGMQDEFGTEIYFNDVLRFDFHDLLETSFIQSTFGQNLKAHNIEECFFHMLDARVYQPEHGWHKSLYYQVYIIRDGRFISCDEVDDPTHVIDGKEEPAYISSDHQRFILYLNKKNKFKVVGHSLNQELTLDYLKSLS